jgi:hypothetical protein
MARYLRWLDARIAELAELTYVSIDALERFSIQLSGGQ